MCPLIVKDPLFMYLGLGGCELEVIPLIILKQIMQRKENKYHINVYSYKWSSGDLSVLNYFKILNKNILSYL